jgi:hypothetical protein
MIAILNIKGLTPFMLESVVICARRKVRKGYEALDHTKLAHDPTAITLAFGQRFTASAKITASKVAYNYSAKLSHSSSPTRAVRSQRIRD